ncbi:MAG: glycine zipper domain-containing protein [Verrucomicrobiota bacterium]|jgi:osmotically inducible lipoprotein OsmB
MWNSNWIKATAVGVLTLGLVGCENLPGDRGTQGAVIGGVSGAAVGAAVGGERHRVLGAILGGALGAAGGYVVGAKTDKTDDAAGAQQATQASQQQPATVEDAMSATTGDLNSDGFVTLDEVVAMDQAGFSDEKILERLRATGQVFELTEEHKKYLTDRGVSRHVVDQMPLLNQTARENVISKPNP